MYYIFNLAPNQTPVVAVRTFNYLKCERLSLVENKFLF